jgi:alanyl-tRNA synthetase
MTLRLYYDDSYLREFSAVITGQTELSHAPAVILDRTAFYPTSGGQPHDIGTLGTARVLNVEEDSSGNILHALDRLLPSGPVQGRIEWEQRFDHMQQHTGQHVLSQAFIQAARAATVSFHLGTQTCTIDVQMPQPSATLIEKAEELANDVVFEDREVRILTVEREQLASLGVRKESEREGDIRVIEIDGFDRSPCGGTHVRQTGEIGMIAVVGAERYKGGTRVEFVCGRRVLRHFRKVHNTLRQLSRLYSAHPDDLPELAGRTFEELAALNRENIRLQGRILEFEAEDLVRNAPRIRDIAVVRIAFDGRPIENLKLLAQKIAGRNPAVAILGGLGPKAQVVVARSADVPGDAGALVKDLCGTVGGRGGGKPELAQAGNIDASSVESWMREAEAHFRSLLLQ